MSKELDLRTDVFSEIDNIKAKHVDEVFVCETDNGILCEMISRDSDFDNQMSEMTSAARALCEESDTVSILHTQTDEDRVAKVKVTNPDFADMDDIEQRVRISHGIELL